MPGCKSLTDAEISLSLNKLTNIRDRCFLILLIRTGFRCSELLSLNVSDAKQYGSIRTHITVTRANMKGSKSSRSVKLHQDALAALELHIRINNLQLDDPLFKSRLGGPIKRWQAWNIVKQAFNAAEITGKTGTHCGRKTLARKVYDASGHDIRVTQLALGHKSLNSTASYLATDAAEVNDLISKLK